jgi:hypothetical protein
MATPSIVVRGCATAEPIVDRENGFLCEDTTESLCRIIDMALSDLEMTRHIGQTARKQFISPGTTLRQIRLRVTKL